MFDFDKTRRLLQKKDYDAVFQKAEKIVTAELIVLYRPNTIGYPRLGLAIAKKAVAKAHDRNRIKRLLRETFRTNGQLPSVDIVVLARGGVKNIQDSVTVAKLDKAWNKLTHSCGK